MCSEECIANCEHRQNAISLIESLPDVNKAILYYLLRFLKVRTLINRLTAITLNCANIPIYPL